MFNFLSTFFKPKTIVKTEIICETEGISEDDQNSNLVAGHMMDDFDGVVAASLYNDTFEATTTFLVYFDNGTTKSVTVPTNSSKYNYYCKFLD